MESQQPGGAAGPQDGHEHHFKVKFSDKGNKIYTVSGDPPCTVLEGIQKKQKYKELNCPDNNLVIKLGRNDDSIVATHFPSSCVNPGEVLTVSCESETVEKTQIQPATAIHSRDRYSVFYIHTLGGTNAKTKKLFEHDAVKKFTYVCVYGEKGTTVEEALQRDGRFSDDLCNFSLSDNENPNCLTEPVDSVDSLNGKKFKICLPRKERPNDEKQQENTGASNYPQDRRLSRSTSVLKVVHQRGRSVRAEMTESSKNTIYALLHNQFPALKELMQSRFPGDSYQEAVELRKEDFGKIQKSFSEVHRVRKLLELGRSVCKVIVKDVCEGSGFVLFDNFILTNAHLFEGYVEEDTLKKGVEVCVLFNYDDPELDTNYCYFEVVNTYSYFKKDELDYAVLELNTESLRMSNLETQTEKIELPPGLLKDFGPMPESGEACLIGHPRGEVKKMDPTCIIEKEKRGQAVYDNVHPYKDSPFILHLISRLIREQGIENIMIGGKLEEKRVTYNTFMYHGSSGSPVFDAQCKVFGLHTGGYVFRQNPTESVIEFAQPLCAILKHSMKMLKAKGLEKLLKRFKEAAKGNSDLQEVLQSVSEEQLVKAEPADLLA